MRRLLFVLALAAATPLQAQSIGELARQSAAARGHAAARTYTDADLAHLTPLPSDAPAATWTPRIQTAPPDAGRAAWFDRMETLRRQLDADTYARDAAETRAADYRRDLAAGEWAINGVIYTNPLTRAAYYTARDEASRWTATIAADRAAIRVLEEQARRANVMPGWLRR